MKHFLGKTMARKFGKKKRQYNNLVVMHIIYKPFYFRASPECCCLHGRDACSAKELVVQQPRLLSVLLKDLGDAEEKKRGRIRRRKGILATNFGDFFCSFRCGDGDGQAESKKECMQAVRMRKLTHTRSPHRATGDKSSKTPPGIWSHVAPQETFW